MTSAIQENKQNTFSQAKNLTLFFERRIATLYGIDSMAMKALDLVREEMCAEKGYKRNNGSDYYNHCVDTANTLISYGIKDEDVVCAALLHDIIEDVPGYKAITLEKLFNKNVARLVVAVTKERDLDYNNPEILQGYLENIMLDKDAAAIKTADKIHNMMSLKEKTFAGRYKTALKTKTFFLPFFTRCGNQYPRYENLFFAARKEIETLIFHIESFYNEIQRLEEENQSLKEQLESLKKIDNQTLNAS